MPSTVAANQTDQNDLLRGFFQRRHPAYDELLPHWEFLESCYKGGRSWFPANIFRYFKEGPEEYADRLNRAYRFNHTREVVGLVQKYLFKAAITRKDDAPEVVRNFWKKATKNGLSIDQLMRQSSVGTAIGGRVAVVVDNNFVEEPVEENKKKRKLSKAELKRRGFRIYAYVVSAKNILDYAFDEDGDGELLWIKLREVVRDDADPLTSSGELHVRVRLWTRTGWELYQEVEDTSAAEMANGQNPTKIVLQASGTHDLGFVPVKLHDYTITEDAYRVPALIDDIAYQDRAVAGYLSSLDAIIQDQTFSQLAIPAQSIVQGDDKFKSVLEMGTKRIFVYDAGAGSSAAPMFLAPDPKQAGVILSVINKTISEIYHTIGLAGERTKEDNAVGIDNSSGVAKAYDFERVNSLLLSQAQGCEQVENWVVDTVLAWTGEIPAEDPLVSYPTTFDVMRLADDLVTAEALATLDAPKEVRRQQMRQTTNKLFPQLAEADEKNIASSIDKWLDDVPLAPPASDGGAPKPATKPVSAPSRQGSVTSATK